MGNRLVRIDESDVVGSELSLEIVDAGLDVLDIELVAAFENLIGIVAPAAAVATADLLSLYS